MLVSPQLYLAIKQFKECMKQPYEALPLQRKAQQHERNLYSGAARGAPDAEKRRALYMKAVEANCRKLNNVVETQRGKMVQTASGSGATQARSESERARNPDSAKYWELLGEMRRYKKFALKYVNGPLMKWISDSQAGLEKTNEAIEEMKTRREMTSRCCTHARTHARTRSKDTLTHARTHTP